MNGQVLLTPTTAVGEFTAHDEAKRALDVLAAFGFPVTFRTEQRSDPFADWTCYLVEVKR